MPRLFFSVLLLCLALPVPSLVRADVVRDLYEALIPVQSQAREERQEAIRAGLREVLVRVSGRSTVSHSPAPAIEKALEKPTRYTQQFRYRKLNKADRKGHLEDSHMVLWVKYDEQAVNTLLRGADLSVWGHTRPATLVWLVVAEEGQRRLLSSNEAHPVREELEYAARLRGLPLRFPFNDLSDRAKISISDIWGNFEEAILQASVRYRPEAVIVGRLYQSVSGSWSARWSIYLQGRRQDIDVDGEVLTQAISPVVAEAAESLAQRFAMGQDENMTGEVMIKIKGVSSLARYNRVINYLASLTAVNKVMPKVVGDDVAIFSLTTESGRLGIAQAINLGHMLVAQSQVIADPSAPGGEQEQAGLVYQLVQ